MTGSQDRLVSVLTSAQRTLSKELAERLAAEQVTVDQWRVLRLLGHPDAADGTATSELAERTQIAAPSLTRLLDGLVDRALVYRKQSLHDGRRIDLHLSDPGRRLLTRLEAIVEAHEQVLARRLGTNGLSDAIAILQRLRSADRADERAAEGADRQ
ncbi:MarR family winged helix-turn-helix transcriptional regulator [Catenulispora subtropica]|uniref:Homoprotocatechuate degradation operon regulator HpaR n=1 Tax=Catenulispora subtropica TaxID=450798 RepID=A0ABN2R1P9_9ACTN